MKRLLTLLASITLFVFVSSSVHAQDTPEQILKRSQDALEPKGVQDIRDGKTSNSESWFTNKVCLIVKVPLLCPVKQIHDVFAPNSKTAEKVDDETLEKINQINKDLVTLSKTSGNVKSVASTSGQVLKADSIGEFLKGFFSVDELLGKDEKREKAVIPGHILPKSLPIVKDTNAPIENEVVGNRLARGALMPEAFNQTKIENVTPKVTNIPVISGTPTSGTASSIQVLAKRAGDWAGVPWQVVEAILKIEGGHVFNLSDEEVVLYQQAGQKVPTNCLPNICSAAGPAQFTTGIDDSGSPFCTECGLSQCPKTWFTYKDAVIEAEDDGRTPEYCNLKDSVYAMAKMLKVRSDTKWGDSSGWTWQANKNAARAYYGSCTPCDIATGRAKDACNRLDGKTYCDWVWDYYQERENVEVEYEGTIYKDGIAMVAGIQKVCSFGGVTGSVYNVNRNCLESVVPKLKSNAILEMRVSAEKYEYLQCVGFVHAAKWQLQNENLPEAGNAMQYALKPPVGYTLYKRGDSFPPQVGDLLVFTSGTYGHIAYIIEIQNANSVQVIEANYGSSGKVQARYVPLNLPGIAGWLRKT